jgi:DNA-binding FadR family transcriptional regulator
VERDELRALQAPLKARYVAEPGAARLSFELETDAEEEHLATLQRLTERYCVVYQTLASAPRLTTAITQA